MDKDKYYPMTREQKEIAYAILSDEGFELTPMDIHQDEYGNEFIFVVEEGENDKHRRYLIDIK